jgi:hypothetical protein
VDDDAQHLFFGGGFAGEDFELARALLDEHLDAGDDGDALLAGHAEQRGFERVVDQIEDELGVEVFRFEKLRGFDSRHADGRCGDDGVEGGFRDGVFLDGLRAGLAGEFLCGLGGAVEDKDFGPFVAQTEDGGACGSACAEDEHLGSAEGHALFERAGDTGDVGVEAVELAVLRTEDGVAGADLGRERVGLLEVRHDLLLERHGDAEALDGNLVDELEEVAELGGLEREVDGVDGLAAEGGVHHDGRERAANGVAGDAIDLGGCVDLIDAIGFDQRAGGDLAGAGLFAYGGGGEGEGRAGADAEDAGDDAGVAHADADDVGVILHAFDEAHEGDVVGERLGRGDDLDEVGLEGNDALVDAFEVFGGGEVVVADDEGNAGVAEMLKLALLHGFGGLELNVDDVEACCRGLGENFNFIGDFAGELAAVGGAAAGGDAGGGGVVGEEMLEFGQGEKRLLEIVEAELEEGRLFDDGAGFFKHLGGCGADDGNTDFTDTGTKKLGGYAGHIHSHVYNRGILQTRAEGCKFLLKSKAVRCGTLRRGYSSLVGCSERSVGTNSRR